MKYAILLVAALAVLSLGYIRLAPNDVAFWHVDPQTVKRGPKPNQFLMRTGDGDMESPVFDLAARDLAQAFDAYALSRPRVTRLAGAPERLWMTYIQRSKWFGFPDYISVRTVFAGGGLSALVIYSRSRYGTSDAGVNKARIIDWVDGLQQRQPVQPAAAAE